MLLPACYESVRFRPWTSGRTLRLCFLPKVTMHPFPVQAGEMDALRLDRGSYRFIIKNKTKQNLLRELGMVARAFNPSTKEVEAGRSL